ncbi:uncharacterized protein [Haliotis cracherodii]|uniref:uncharacterized protein n=1 Tax=Haliotis cracherodii TaxID=6455 RepID=UPI0039EBC8D1
MKRVVFAVLALVSLSEIQSAPTTADPGCGQNPADIVFLLDSSGSVGKTNFQKQLDFVSKFANSFSIGPQGVQIGVTTFATHPTNRFWLNSHTNKADLVKNIQAVPYSGGSTATDEALSFVKNQAFTKAHGDRDKVANILIVMTDGQSNVKAKTAAQAASIKKGTTWSVFAIGIGSGASKPELNTIATDSKHVFTVENFSALQNIQATLKKTACQIDGQWNKWGFYSPCTKKCGGGTQYRERTCSNPPPSHGGKPCAGAARETKACATTPCTTTAKPTTTPRPTHATTSTVAPGCGLQPADIVFIVDSSGSVGSANFQKMLTFIETMVQGFDIGPQGVQIGMITFDSKTYLQFHLNKYASKSDIIKAIKATKYTRGNTYTHLALQYARQTSFTAANGARPNAAKIAIVITDGQSNIPTSTKTEAQKLKDAGVTVFSIGVGSGARQTELQAMATDPDSQHVFIVTNFDALKLIKSQLQQKACEVKPTVVVTTPAPAKPNCGAQADIVFLLDESGSVGRDNYKKMLAFVNQIADDFSIGPHDVQIGLETFSSTTRHQFDMNKYADKTALKAAITKTPYHGGNTHTGDALAYLSSHSFTKAAGMRDNVPHIAFVLTDGNSQQRTLTKTNGAKLQGQGVKVMAIGIGNGINNQELDNIASNPDSQYVFRAANFDALKNLKAILASKACEVAKPKPDQTTPLPKLCGSQADIVFMLDSSGSVGSSNFNLLLTFVKSIVQDFDVASNKIRIGVEKFSSRPYLEFHLNQYSNKQDVLNAVTNIKYVSGGTNTGDALKYLQDNMFNTKNGDRPGVPNIAIIITDGRSNKPDQTKTFAKAARDKGTQVFSVGVGKGISMAELNEMASDPDSAHVMSVDDFSKLPQIKALFAKKACAVIPPSLAPYVPTPSSSSGPLIDPCQDAITDCDRYPDTVCREFTKWSEVNCQRTCHICTPSIPSTPAPCVDVLDKCKSYLPTSCLPPYDNWAKTNCRKYCGYCDAKAVTGYFGTCFYKGSQYKQGQKWEDGCEYECECTDASHGQYNCYNRCPAYYNLPPQCTLVRVNSSCCLQPVCDFDGKYETTSGQNVGNLNGNKVCVYGGKQYYQSQTWQVGCEFECKCEDAGVGLWSCQSVCAQYGTLPKGCKLVTKPGECCAKPDCEFNTQVGSFTGQGTTSGSGDKLPLTTVGPCVDTQSNCNSYAPDACTKYKRWAMDNCRKHCNLCLDAYLPGPNDFCLYKGHNYTQGQRWTDGCNGECFCDNAKYGYYRCNDACPKYFNIPPGCSLETAKGQCCKVMTCKTGSFVGSSTNPGSLGAYPVPTLPNQPTPVPGQQPTPRPYLAPQKLAGCMFQGTLYKQGQRWTDGCDYSCSCDDGVSGRFTCSPRCPSFTGLPSGCVLKDTPNDPCCQLPDCSGAPAGTTVVPTYGPGFTGYGPAVYPSGYGPGVSGTGLPPIQGQTQAPLTGNTAGCHYHGKTYQAGQTWADGCQYKCACIDGNTGYYKCTDRCPQFQNLPAQCSLITDPNDSCCKTYQCNFAQQATTPKPLFAVTTPQPGVDYCVYKGLYYRQGEQWSDGCTLTCRCEDAKNNYHQCTDRCPSFTNVPLGCKLVPDQRDPQCCKVPECDSANQGTGTGSIQPLGFLGSFTGYGRPPGTNLPSQVGYRDACIYKGQIHNQGDTWQDGCSLDCECLDAKSGKYRCTDRCQRYASLPAGCVLIPDVNDRCCQKAECAPPSQGGCVDKKADCYLYGDYSCRDPYTAWAKTNCAKFCGFCGTKTSPNPLSCKDEIPNCNEYPKDNCVGEYASWAKFNCPKYCGYCGGGAGPVTTPRSNIIVYGSAAPVQTGGSHTGCSDSLATCAQYSQAACHDPYVSWAINNCPKFCGLCDQVGKVPQGTQGTVTMGGNGGGISGSGTNNPMFVTEYPMNAITGFNAGCYYKGRVYKTGEEWQDGCQYNCSCVNGQTGYYKCISGCQTFPNLPAGCTLQKLAGSCCETPVCPGSGTGTGTGTNTGGTCLYKGKSYQQGMTWNDGCDFTCTCTDAAASRYQCRQRCIAWSLPAACTIHEPAPGKCCKTPTCPPGYTISYPPGYTAE